MYKLTDCNGLSDTARVDLNYAQPPIPVNDRIPYSASFFRTAAQGVLVNDQNSPACPNTPATASVVTPPRNTLSLNPDGSFNYLVLTTGDDSFVYRVTVRSRCQVEFHASAAVRLLENTGIYAACVHDSYCQRRSEDRLSLDACALPCCACRTATATAPPPLSTCRLWQHPQPQTTASGMWAGASPRWPLRAC